MSSIEHKSFNLFKGQDFLMVTQGFFHLIEDALREKRRFTKLKWKVGGMIAVDIDEFRKTAKMVATSQVNFLM